MSAAFSHDRGLCLWWGCAILTTKIRHGKNADIRICGTAVSLCKGIVHRFRKFQFVGEFERYGHCEKVAHTGVAIPHNDGIVSYFDDKCLKI